MSASFRATPVDVRHEASNTTRSFVVVLSGLKTQWCGRSGFADSRFSSPRKRLMAVDLDSPRRWTAYFFLGSVTTNLPVSSRTVVSSNSCSHVRTFGPSSRIRRIRSGQVRDTSRNGQFSAK
ncbi:uncharacterized protein LOC120431420 [Culex pipiens pallens]|uniref:uncharacterized protein LOC120431420 n=1 Tax=Culex pipiens pallens TaxID=42434 RepID=UPI0019544F2A|nr:uncharacterized protein LOC120431420 [Culex pipiens pallens]